MSSEAIMYFPFPPCIQRIIKLGIDFKYFKQGSIAIGMKAKTMKNMMISTSLLKYL